MPFALRRKKSRNIFFKILWLKKVLKKKKKYFVVTCIQLRVGEVRRKC